MPTVIMGTLAPSKSKSKAWIYLFGELLPIANIFEQNNCFSIFRIAGWAREWAVNLFFL